MQQQKEKKEEKIQRFLVRTEHFHISRRQDTKFNVSISSIKISHLKDHSSMHKRSDNGQNSLESERESNENDAAELLSECFECDISLVRK